MFGTKGMGIQKNEAFTSKSLTRNLLQDRYPKFNLLHNCLRKLLPIILRTFARQFSNIDFFLQILPLKDDELVMSEM